MTEFLCVVGGIVFGAWATYAGMMKQERDEPARER